MKRIVVFFILIISFFSIYGNNLTSVLNPTAGVLSKGEARLYQVFYSVDGIMFGADVGLFDNFQFGIIYGGQYLLGSNSPQWNNKPDVNVKFRIINETISFPAIAVGIDTYGHGNYHKEHKRYDIKSKGAYFVASKNFSLAGLLGLDFGMNYTFESHDDEEENFDVFAGMYKTIGDNLTFFMDYSFGLNDRSDEENFPLRNRGYLNAAAQMRINDQLSVKLQMHDLMINNKKLKTFDRSIVIDYRWFF